MAIESTCLWASVDDVKPWLRLTPADVSRDAVIESIINAASTDLERLTGRVFVERSFTDRFDSRRTARFRLRAYPVSAITAFQIDGVDVDTSLYSLDAEHGLVTLTGGAWLSSRGLDDVTITYTAGYARGNLPAGYLQAGAELAAFTYAQWSAGLSNLQQASIGGQSATQFASMPWSLRDKIEAIRLEYRIGVA